MATRWSTARTSAIMGQVACYTGQPVTWDQITQSEFEFEPKLADVRLESEGRYTECRRQLSAAGAWSGQRPPVSRWAVQWFCCQRFAARNGDCGNDAAPRMHTVAALRR